MSADQLALDLVPAPVACIASRWTLRLRDGHVVTGAIHGSAGMVRQRARLEQLIRRGERAAVHPDYCAQGDGRRVWVSLAGAVIIGPQEELAARPKTRR